MGKNKEKIENMKKQTQRVRYGRTAFYLLAETKLKNEFLEKRKKGMSVKLWWLWACVKQLIKDLYLFTSIYYSRDIYQNKDIANKDQTPLPFILDDNKTYAEKGLKDVAKTGAAGLDKHQ